MVLKPLILVVIALFVSCVLLAQENIVQDTIVQDSIVQDISAQDTIVQSSTAPEKPAKEQKRKKKINAFKVYAGATLNDLNGSSDAYASETQAGFILGASYQHGRSFYYEIGARYNHYYYQLNGNLNQDLSPFGGDPFAVGVVEVPINGGINLTSFISRLLGVRLFVGAVPSFNLYLEDGISKDDINKFNIHAQAGLGIDVAFIFAETGYKYGFNDFFKNDIQSNPEQFFVSLGFRF